MSEVKPSVRKTLYSDTKDEQAAIAASALIAIESTEKLHINFRNDAIVPSSLNPRRRSLDQAGVTPETISRMAIKDGESKETWLDRANNFIKTLDEKHQQVWSDLFDLASSILFQGLLQPIIVNSKHIIVAGERRWTASQLAGKTHSRVIVREFSELEEVVFRLAENLRRSDLSVAETVSGLRSVVAMAFGPCAPDNDKITIYEISALTGAGRTTAAYYRAFCRLPDDDPVLDSILDGDYSNIKAAYAEAASRVRYLLDPKQSTDATEASSTPESLSSELGKTESKAKAPEAKIKLQIRPSMNRLINVFATLDGIPDNVSSEITELSSRWPEATDKEKTDILTQALNLAIEFLESSE